MSGARRSVAGALVLAALCSCAAQRGTIGAVLGQAPDGTLYVRDVPPDLAAGKAGLQAGDQILTIDGKDVRMLSAEQVHKALSGTVGERVKLTLLRGEKVIRVTLARTPARRLHHAAP